MFDLTKNKVGKLNQRYKVKLDIQSLLLSYFLGVNLLIGITIWMTINYD